MKLKAEMSEHYGSRYSQGSIDVYCVFLCHYIATAPIAVQMKTELKIYKQGSERNDVFHTCCEQTMFSL